MKNLNLFINLTCIIPVLLISCFYSHLLNGQAGVIDASFNPGTGANSGVFSTSVQTDGKIVIGGSFTIFNGTGRARLARIDSNGTIDPSLTGIGANNLIRETTIQNDGKILVGGDFVVINNIPRSRIARLNANGSVDTSFDPGTGPSSGVYKIAIQSDGKIIICGNFSSYNGINRKRIARLNDDGSLDLSFDPGTGPNAITEGMVIQPDGKIIINGGFTQYNGVSRNGIARINQDGSLDTSFNPGTGANGNVLGVALQTDGKIMIGGNFTSYNGTNINNIARINSNGILDTSFNPGSGTSTIKTIIIQNDGKIIIGGNFTSYNGTSRNRLARIHPTGALDTSFDPGTGANDWVYDLAFDSPAKIIIVGEFTDYNGITRNRIARIWTMLDADADLVDDATDNCLGIFNPNQENYDGDSKGDICDGCPTDPNKIEPGICGCGIADTDSDGDLTLDCFDNCPTDPNKIEPGICGCGFADIDTDGDLTIDCFDDCPLDPNKIATGICGCGVADTDTDGDSTADCNDGCPNDPNKITEGICGCGVADTDTDDDGTADCNDGCPNDPDKVEAGVCGCGNPDTDTDEDGEADCNDGCPNDPDKTVPGICGCGVADTDSDEDGTVDCNDGCPSDPNKVAPGQCGCGTPDFDDDCDGVANCHDVCPNGDDSVDNDFDGNHDCQVYPGFSFLPASWTCSNNNNSEKVIICHDGASLCVSENSLAQHLAHGDNIGPCHSCIQEMIQIPNLPLWQTEGQFEVYPNPVTNVINIILNDYSGTLELTVADQFGRIMRRLELEEGVMTVGIDVSGDTFSSGIYYVSILSPHQRVTQRVILVK